MDAFRHDLRFAVRSFLRNPGFSAITVVTLAIGVGATTAIFSVIYGVLLRPLPYSEPERIVRVWALDADGGRTDSSDPTFADWQARSRSFAALAQVQGPYPVSVSGDAEPARVSGASISRGFFQVVGVEPVAGRLFVAEEQRFGGAPAVLVSRRFWERHLGSARDFASKTLVFDGRVHKIVGVLPASLAYPPGVDLYVPRELREVLPSRTAHNWAVVGRLRPGVTLAQAQVELSTVTRGMKAEYGDDTRTVDARLVPLHEQIVGRVRPALLTLLGASAFLLLIACANVGNLLLARTAVRQRELAVRLAMGAGRRRLVQQFLAEALVTSLVAAAVGVVVAVAGVELLLALEPDSVPRLGEVGVSWTALAFTVGIALATAAGLGLVTAIRGAGEEDLRVSLAQSQRGLAASGGYLRGGLTVAQVALTLVLLVGAGLLGRSIVRLLAVDPGYRTAGTLVLDLSMPWPENRSQVARNQRFAEDLTARLRGIPGVADVGGVNAFPLSGAGANGTFLVLSRPDEPLDFSQLSELMKDPDRSGYADYRVASGGYFRAMNIPLLRGRLFDERDGPDAPHAALISRTLAEKEWPNADPIGRVIQFGNMDGDLRPFTIVGIVGDVRERGLDDEPRATFYGHSRQRRIANFSLVLHGSAKPTSLIAPARRALRELAPNMPPRFRTIEDVVASSMAQRRFALVLLAAFGAAALLLATMGVYSVVAYLVAQREHEIGIRVALGAQRADVLGIVLRHGAVLTLIGVGVGLGAAFWLTRLLTGMLYGVTPTDPASYGAVVGLLLGVALAASYLPARRAMRVDPMRVLRNG